MTTTITNSECAKFCIQFTTTTTTTKKDKITTKNLNIYLIY